MAKFETLKVTTPYSIIGLGFHAYLSEVFFSRGYHHDVDCIIAEYFCTKTNFNLAAKRFAATLTVKSRKQFRQYLTVEPLY